MQLKIKLKPIEWDDFDEKHHCYGRIVDNNGREDIVYEIEIDNYDYNEEYIWKKQKCNLFYYPSKISINVRNRPFSSISEAMKAAEQHHKDTAAKYLDGDYEII